ncbi:DUF4169 family protein [Ferrovibrio sp. MS7]|uniref:DUF4169 family protein n=1 Tax=Ferrovibrio plantarum TaxID=3119164 RepID=UPI003136250A
MKQSDAMGNIVNLNKARKAKARDAKATQAAANRARHGMSKAEREKAAKEAERIRREIDGSKLED